jgi:hypothetical protein
MDGQRAGSVLPSLPLFPSQPPPSSFPSLSSSLTPVFPPSLPLLAHQVVEPKKKKLAESEAELEIVMTALRGKQAELKAVMDKLAQLDADLQVGVGFALSLALSFSLSPFCTEEKKSLSLSFSVCLALSFSLCAKRSTA